MTSAKAAGDRGEDLVARYLQKAGYTLLDRQWRCRFGELDLVARSREGIVCFVEVKLRGPKSMGLPREAVDARKQNRLILAAQQYLQHSPYRDAAIRFDVVEVTPAARGWQVHCIPGAFEC